MEGSTMYPNLDGLTKALEVQGGLKGPTSLRDDAGLYLHHDIGNYLSRQQTYQREESSAATALINGFVFTRSPDTYGIRYGRYLIAFQASATNATGLVSGCILLQNSGTQPDYPATGQGAVIATFGNTVRVINSGLTVVPVLDFTPVALPLWCPPGSVLTMLLNGNAAGGNWTLYTHWLTTEEKNVAGVPTGQLRAPILK